MFLATWTVTANEGFSVICDADEGPEDVEEYRMEGESSFINKGHKRSLSRDNISFT